MSICFEGHIYCPRNKTCCCIDCVEICPDRCTLAVEEDNPAGICASYLED